jgi:chemotaxis protein histidine kinase CheA
MTISSTTRRAGPFLGNDATTTFPFQFKVFTKNDVRVTFTDTSDAESTLTVDSDYSVTLNADQDNNPGGSVEYPISGSPLATGEKLTLSGALANTQTADITNAGGFYPEVIEDALDRATVQIQQLAEQSDRAVRVPISDPRTPEDYWQDLFVAADAAAQSAANSASSASSSAQAAAASEGNAASSEQAAATSESNAASSEQAAATSESNAQSSEQAAALSESNALASEQAAALSETSAATSAQLSMVGALRAENAAQTVTTPIASVVARYLDNFIPTGQLVSFSDIYTPGGFDLGTLADAVPFANEDSAMRRASLSAGTGNFDYGQLA